MPTIKTSDRIKLYVKDWGHGRPVVLIHGWPLNADSWEHQALALAKNGYRVVTYDRRGFGRSEQPFTGYDYDTLADDLAAVIKSLSLQDAAIVGFSMGGGEVVRYMSRHDGAHVKQVALIASIAPFMLQTDDNPNGVPAEVLDAIQAGIRADRPQFLADFFPDFYGQGSNAGGVSDGVYRWTLSMALQASPKATLDCVDAFGRTDLRPDMPAINVPTLVVHGTGDATVPIDPSGRAAAALIKQAELKEYKGAPHGLTITHAEQLNRDLLEFLSG